MELTPATGIRIITATILEAAPISYRDSVDRRSRLLDGINGLADLVRMPPATVACNLGGIVQLVEEAIQAESDELLTASLRTFLELLRAQDGSNLCRQCAQNHPAQPLCAQLGEAPHRQPSHLCIGQVAVLLRDLEQRSRAIYEPVAEESKRVRLKFSLVPVARGSVHGFIPEFHLDGGTQARGEDVVVQIVLEDRSLDLRTLRQLAYVGVHELICHAFQGVSGTERSNVGASCSWSEGWMDAVAWMLLERWLTLDAAKLPPWLVQAPTPRIAIEDCRKLHERRYEERQGRVMDPENILRRQQAREACDALFRNWSGPELRRRLSGLRKLVQFSAKLNVASLDRTQRERLIVQLVSGLLLPTGDALDRTILACEQFLSGDIADAHALMAYLPAHCPAAECGAIQ